MTTEFLSLCITTPCDNVRKSNLLETLWKARCSQTFMDGTLFSVETWTPPCEYRYKRPEGRRPSTPDLTQRSPADILRWNTCPLTGEFTSSPLCPNRKPCGGRWTVGELWICENLTLRGAPRSVLADVLMRTCILLWKSRWAALCGSKPTPRCRVSVNSLERFTGKPEEFGANLPSNFQLANVNLSH